MNPLLRIFLLEWIPLLWLAWLLYWWLGAGRLKAVERRESRLQRASHGVPLALAVLLFVLPGHDLGALATPFIARSWTGYGIGVALVALGLGYAVQARRHLGANWSGTVTLKQEHSLIRSGPYRHVRHPIYTGILLAFVGSALALAEWRGVLAVLLAAVALIIKLRREERWMLERFGSDYAEYRKASWALLPGVY
ncbi:Isoprenylcysteine carboxyl methyltransferase [mine drainage metagenome]|uniref:Isoprenylcysteine carboxyl methyltransferase n=1 Tax=mine drainage metagenome TaxID=410659 RepID=T1CEX2_9ZZZZ